MTNNPLVIAIDGPSGSGKSSTSKGVATKLGLAYLDTGAMYRAVTCAFLDAEVDPSDEAGVIAATTSANVEISTDPQDQWVRVNGVDVTERIREPEVSAKVSTVSTIADCRADLVARQRAIIEAAADGIVAEGRDITTVVAPDAALRVLLTADPEVRMARRQAELGGQLDAAQLADQVLRRDSDDSKLVNFTTAADGVTHVDGTDLTLAQAIDLIVDLATQAAAAGRPAAE